MVNISKKETHYFQKCCNKLLKNEYFLRDNKSVRSHKIKINTKYNGEEKSDLWSLVKDVRLLNDIREKKRNDCVFAMRELEQAKRTLEDCHIEETVIGRTLQIILKIEGNE